MSEQIDSLDIAEFIRKERLRKNITREQLAYRTDIDPSLLFRYEMKGVQMRFDTANRLLSALGYEIVIMEKK